VKWQKPGRRRSERSHGGATKWTTLTARSEPYNRAALHVSRLGKGSTCAIALRLGKAMWPRETTARSGDIGARSDRQRHRQSLIPFPTLFATERSGPERKTTLSLAARTRWEQAGIGGGSEVLAADG
jgi:hypothetical protein